MRAARGRPRHTVYWLSLGELSRFDRNLSAARDPGGQWQASSTVSNLLPHRPDGGWPRAWLRNRTDAGRCLNKNKKPTCFVGAVCEGPERRGHCLSPPHRLSGAVLVPKSGRSVGVVRRRGARHGLCSFFLGSVFLTLPLPFFLLFPFLLYFFLLASSLPPLISSLCVSPPPFLAPCSPIFCLW